MRVSRCRQTRRGVTIYHVSQRMMIKMGDGDIKGMVEKTGEVLVSLVLGNTFDDYYVCIWIYEIQ